MAIQRLRRGLRRDENWRSSTDAGGGVTPGYAVTSFKAEGQTYDAGRNLAAPSAVNTEGMYVALTRGRNDQRTYTIDPAALLQERAELPVIADDRSALEVLNQSLNKSRSTDLATIEGSVTQPRPGDGAQRYDHYHHVQEIVA